MSKVLIPIPLTDFDPSECAISWKRLTELGHQIVFSTQNAKEAKADDILIQRKLGWLNFMLAPRSDVHLAYHEMLQSAEFKNPISFHEIKGEDFNGILFPGGHAKGIRPYLESKKLQNLIVEYFEQKKPVAAICHGVLAVARSIIPKTGKSVLFGRKTTGLPKMSEMIAYYLTKRTMGDYYLTYPEITLQDEVSGYLESQKDFREGPPMILKDSEKCLWKGFVVIDGNYISARWPGDVYRFSYEFHKMLIS